MSYKPLSDGFRSLGMDAAVGAVTLAAAKSIAGNAQAVGRGTYEAVPAIVTAGWSNERRTGAIVRESSPDYRDSRDAILLRVIASMKVGR